MVFRKRIMKFDLSLALFTLLHILSLSQAQRDDQAQALLAIKEAVGGASTNLTSWNPTSVGPCLGKWSKVQCDTSKKITSLNLSSCSLQGKLPDIFGKLTSLIFLDFSQNKLESPFPNLDQLKSLRVLDFSTNHLNEYFPKTIFSLTNLVKLSMSNNYLAAPVPDSISNLLWLEELNLHHTKLHGPLPEEWGKTLNKLEKLYLYSNDLSGSIPDTWKGIILTGSLRELQVANNKLSGTVPDWLLLQKNNATVNFTCNYLSGPKPTSFDVSSWNGNCFDIEPQSHDKNCDGYTCSNFFKRKPKYKKSFPEEAVVGIIIAAIVVLCGILGLVYWARPGVSNNRRRRRGDQGNSDWTVPEGIRRLTYREIAKATKSFDKSCEIGEGGFGKVYMAQLEDGKHVAIKRASDLSFQGTKEFQNEIDLLSRLHHRHLVRLEGFCDDGDEQILVYEYMSNGNLHHHLFDKHASSLNWYKRIEIALAVAQGLEYLHSFANPPVIHRDVKPSNILLDENMVAKVSDFGISKANPEMDTHVSTRPVGTAGYLDPEYFLRRQLTTASDVYGYGVVLLELVTGQRAIDHKRLEEDYNLVGWVKLKLVRERIHAVIDPRLGPNFPADQYEEVAHLAMDCTAFERDDRPTMQTIASTLERILSSLVPPPEQWTRLVAPSLSPLIRGTDSNSKTFGGSAEVLSDVKTEFQFTDTQAEPR